MYSTVVWIVQGADDGGQNMTTWHHASTGHHDRIYHGIDGISCHALLLQLQKFKQTSSASEAPKLSTPLVIFIVPPLPALLVILEG